MLKISFSDFQDLLMEIYLSCAPYSDLSKYYSHPKYLLIQKEAQNNFQILFWCLWYAKEYSSPFLPIFIEYLKNKNIPPPDIPPSLQGKRRQINNLYYNFFIENNLI